MYKALLALIFESAPLGFSPAAERLVEYVNSSHDILDVIQQIGTIPESIDHDSTEEKLFAKASDAVLSRAFRELGLKSRVITERADAADVIAESHIYGYSLVADAKAFRMSRTAKNQKDFKVTALSAWRGDSDYAVLCSPFFQYPQAKSQIYAQAINHNVALISWEHLTFLLKHQIRESETVNLAPIWNYCKDYSRSVVVAESKRCFIPDYSRFIIKHVGYNQNDFSSLIKSQIEIIKRRGGEEHEYWEKQKSKILSFTREKAIAELLKSKKIDEKIARIDSYVRGLRNA
ncbi:MAG: HindIII family type II restriction endonuclease [Oscillospiraceae bacterium]|jgi:type II restriction enzyme|nr:HindIII family type II restriction endonuclease [Oscillospiraceae bacterium]